MPSRLGSDLNSEPFRFPRSRAANPASSDILGGFLQMKFVVDDDRSEQSEDHSIGNIFNALSIGHEYLWRPERLVSFHHWIGHIPFAFWIVKTLRPRVFVELGTHRGNSYCAMCQAVSSFQILSAGYAVDTWHGDQHMAFEPEIFEELKRYHDPKYGAFSTLINSNFDEALARFHDGEIDLLHIDGTHTYDAVSHDFEKWLPKLSSRGVVMFHDIMERQADFGVWRLWGELRRRYPSFEFRHSHGLGVISTGSERPVALENLLQRGASEHASIDVRNIFETRGQSFVDQYFLADSQNASRPDVETLMEAHRSEILALDERARREAARRREHFEYEKQGLISKLHNATTSEAIATAKARLAAEKVRRIEAEYKKLMRRKESERDSRSQAPPATA